MQVNSSPVLEKADSEDPSLRQLYKANLRLLLDKANISSARALARHANVSDWQVSQLSQGKAAQIRLEVLYKLSQALQISLADLLATFSALPALTFQKVESDSLRLEYQRLQVQLEQQQDLLYQEFQRSTLRSLESWLLQFPTLAYAAQQNPQFPAKSFLPFMRPLEQLLQSWGVEAIAPVGSELPYDPHLHQLMEGTAAPGERVKVRYTGYCQGEKLLYRAKVSRTGPVVQPSAESKQAE